MNADFRRQDKVYGRSGITQAVAKVNSRNKQKRIEPYSGDPVKSIIYIWVYHDKANAQKLTESFYNKMNAFNLLIDYSLQSIC